MSTPLQQLQQVLDFLGARGWQHKRDAKRFYVYSPPSSGGADAFELLVPRDPIGSDFERALAHSIEAIASFYQAPFTSIEALLLPSSEVLAVRLAGEGFAGGAAPFPQFERMLEHLKRTLTRTAAFVITDDPVTQSTPGPARHYLDDCWFMQTARGSFITRVAIPVAGSFERTLTLFSKPVEKVAVASTMRGVSRLIGQRVLEDDMDLLSDDGFAAIRSLVSVAVLEEMSKLFRGAGAQSISFSFNRQGEEEVVSFPRLTHERLYALDTFIGRVRERLRARFPIDTAGRVLEVRRSRRRSSSSFVGILAQVQDRQELVTFKVEREDLPTFLDLFKSQQSVRVRGKARRLRTQIRIEDDFRFDEP